MKSLNSHSVFSQFLTPNALQVFNRMPLISTIYSCAPFSNAGGVEYEVNYKIFQLTGNSKIHKSIFVFLDGTSNDSQSGTNVGDYMT